MISKTRGTFEHFSGTIVTAENPLDSSVTATAQVASITTKDADRDAHLRSADFFDAESFPELSFVSRGVRPNGEDYWVDGDLTIRGVTQPVTFAFEFNGFNQDPWGNYRAGAVANAKVSREAFGLVWNAALETGGVLVGDEVTITLELEAVLQP